MNTTLHTRLTQFWQQIQNNLFPFLNDIDLALTPKLQEVVTVLEMIGVERFLGGYQFSAIGRPCKDRTAIARAFVAKAVLNLPTTEALIDRLKIDISLRRICAFSSTHSIPDKSRFSRAFAEFARYRLAERVHAALITENLGDQLICHISRDSTAIIARERPQYKPATPIEAISTPPKKRGRPRKDAPVVIVEKVPTRIEQQQAQSLAAMLRDLPRICDKGSKFDSQNFKSSWNGYKLHIDTADGDIPISCILSSASLHDSQAMMPLMQKTSAQVQYCYDLADAAYCNPLLREASRKLGHVPLIDHNPRRGEKINFAPHEALRYKARSSAERVNAHLKDSHGGRHVWVRGSEKVMAHLMFGIVVITAEQLLRLVT